MLRRAYELFIPPGRRASTVTGRSLDRFSARTTVYEPSFCANSCPPTPSSFLFPAFSVSLGLSVFLDRTDARGRESDGSYTPANSFVIRDIGIARKLSDIRRSAGTINALYALVEH